MVNSLVLRGGETVVAVDRTETGATGLRAALRLLAEQPGARLTVIRVHDSADLGGVVTRSMQDEDVRRAAEGELRQLAESEAGAVWHQVEDRVHFVVRAGLPEDVLPGECKSRGASLLILAAPTLEKPQAHRRTRERITLRAPCSVLVVRE